MRGAADDPGTQLREAGWQQGSILSPELLEKLGLDSRKLAVVVSQDCDIVQSVAVEPTVEVLLGEELSSLRPDRQNGRNPRHLDVPLESENGLRGAGFHVRDRKEIPKAALAGHRPSALTMPPREVGTIARWIAKRYTRAAFPDEFNRRLQTINKRLEKLSKKESSSVISGIYILLSPRDADLTADASYAVVVWLTVPTNVGESPEQWAKALTFEREFAEALEQCPGLEPIEVELRNEKDVSLHDLRVMRRLDLDYRSIAERPGGEIAPSEPDG